MLLVLAIGCCVRFGASGATVEVAWTLQSNHGGGYSYRVCPAGEKLTEACFQQHPLDFVGASQFRWGGKGGHSLNFTAVTVSEGPCTAPTLREPCCF